MWGGGEASQAFKLDINAFAFKTLEKCLGGLEILLFQLGSSVLPWCVVNKKFENVQAAVTSYCQRYL